MWIWGPPLTGSRQYQRIVWHQIRSKYVYLIPKSFLLLSTTLVAWVLLWRCPTPLCNPLAVTCTELYRVQAINEMKFTAFRWKNTIWIRTVLARPSTEKEQEEPLRNMNRNNFQIEKSFHVIECWAFKEGDGAFTTFCRSSYQELVRTCLWTFSIIIIICDEMIYWKNHCSHGHPTKEILAICPR